MHTYIDSILSTFLLLLSTSNEEAEPDDVLCQEILCISMILGTLPRLSIHYERQALLSKPEQCSEVQLLVSESEDKVRKSLEFPC